MKKMIKIASILVLAIMISMMTINVVLATTAAPDPSSITGKEGFAVDGVSTIGNQVITIISTVGSIAAVVVLVVLGLKYMMGSAEEKADYKKTLIPYVIGACLVFAASAIAGIIFGFAQNIGGQ